MSVYLCPAPDIVRMAPVNRLEITVILSQNGKMAEGVRDAGESRATAADRLRSFPPVRRGSMPPPGGVLTASIGAA